MYKTVLVYENWYKLDWAYKTYEDRWSVTLGIREKSNNSQ